MNQTAESPIRAAGVLLVTREQPREFLLMRHASRWDLPKGHCEPGESFRQAALREMEEETGIDRGQVELDEQFVFELKYPVQYPNRPHPVDKQVRYFLATIDTKPSLQLTEHVGYHWFRWAPPHRIQSETIDPLLAAVAEHLNRD